MTSDPNPQIGLNAEACVTAAAIMHPAFWDAIARPPEAEDFEDPGLAQLWSAVLDVRRRGRVTRQAVVLRLREAQLVEADCFGALKHVRPEFVTVTEAVEAAAFLLDRRLRKQAHTIINEHLTGLATVGNVVEHVEGLERGLNDIVTNHAAVNGFRADFACDVSKDIFRGAALGRRIQTGWTDLDGRIRGWPRGKMSIIAARPSMGKSAFAICAGRKLAEHGAGVGFVSMEMNTPEIWIRMAADYAYDNGRGPEYEAVMHGKARPDDVRALEAAVDRVRDLPFAINDRAALKVADIHRWARRLDREFRNGGRKLDVLIVDYLQLARPDKNRQGNKVQEVSDISADLLALAKDLDVALIALSQLSRAPEQRGNPRPQLSDLRDSGSLEQDAEMVGMLFRPAYYFERKAREDELTYDQIREAEANKHVLEIDWQKNRNGKTGITRMFCDVGRNAVRDAAPTYRSVAA
jgi:replicative DNA helicase